MPVMLKNDCINGHCYGSPSTLSCLFVFPFNASDLHPVKRLMAPISTAELRRSCPCRESWWVPGVDKPQLFLLWDQKTCSIYTVVAKNGLGKCWWLQSKALIRLIQVILPCFLTDALLSWAADLSSCRYSCFHSHPCTIILVNDTVIKVSIVMISVDLHQVSEITYQQRDEGSTEFSGPLMCAAARFSSEQDLSCSSHIESSSLKLSGMQN